MSSLTQLIRDIKKRKIQKSSKLFIQQKKNLRFKLLYMINQYHQIVSTLHLINIGLPKVKEWKELLLETNGSTKRLVIMNVSLVKQKCFNFIKNSKLQQDFLLFGIIFKIMQKLLMISKMCIKLTSIRLIKKTVLNLKDVHVKIAEVIQGLFIMMVHLPLF